MDLRCLRERSIYRRLTEGSNDEAIKASQQCLNPAHSLGGSSNVAIDPLAKLSQHFLCPFSPGERRGRRTRPLYDPLQHGYQMVEHEIEFDELLLDLRSAFVAVWDNDQFFPQFLQQPEDSFDLLFQRRQP